MFNIELIEFYKNLIITKKTRMHLITNVNCPNNRESLG